MRNATIVLLSAALLCACDRAGRTPRLATADRDPRLPQPAVTALGRLSLAESDTLYVGRPAGLAVDPADGSLYVTDAFWGRVLRFTPAGAPLRPYGERGDGPGQLRDPGAVDVSANVVAVADVGGGRLARFARDGGAFLESVPVRGVLTSVREQDGRVWLGSLDAAGKTSVGTWAPGERQARHLGELPREFVQSQPLAGIYTGVQVAAWGDTVLAGYMGLNRLTLFRGDGTHVRDLSVPVRARKGEIPGVVNAAEELEFPDLFSANSALFRLVRLPGGSFGLVHYDQTIQGRLITARVYVSILSADLSRACVDREIAVSKDAQPYTAFRGDTLYVLQQSVRGERAATFVDRYLVDERSCTGAMAANAAR